VYRRHIRDRWPPPAFFERNPFFPEYGFEWDDFIRLLMADIRDNGTAAECAFPEVPRTRHVIDPSGSTHSTTAQTQRERLDPLLLSSAPPPDRDPFAQAHAFLASLPQHLYDQRIAQWIDQGILLPSLAHARHYFRRELVLPCPACHSDPDQEQQGTRGWAALMEQIGLIGRGVDGIVRGIHKGTVQTRWLGNSLLLVSSDSPFFPQVLDKMPPAAPAAQDPPATEIFVVSRQGESCQEACERELATSCLIDRMPLANECPQLERFLDCQGGCLRGERMGALPPNRTCFHSLHRHLHCHAKPPALLQLCTCTSPHLPIPLGAA